MENASKALLIAGAVLIVILIIGVGMAIFTAGQGNIDSAIAQMSTQEKQIFNAQFDQYAGTITATKLRSLNSAVVANNGNPEAKAKVTFTVKASASDTGNVFSNSMVGSTQLGVNNKYEVSFGYTDGLITSITAIKK